LKARSGVSQTQSGAMTINGKSLSGENGQTMETNKAELNNEGLV
jgi:hypothetical protein